MPSITVRKVENKADYKVFFEFPWRVYADNPYWVPPLKSTRKHILDQEHDASWKYMEGDYFVAWKGDEPVGTIAAFVNHRHNETWNENIGWFGAFDFIDDPEVAATLLKTAEDYVREKGYDAIRGPATFHLHSEMGVLLDNYDKTPILLMPYNHPYYPQHIESAGFSKIKDVFTWTTTSEHLQGSGGPSKRLAQIQRLVEKVQERRKITVRRGNKSNKRQDFEIIYELYNAGWKDNWGFVPLTRAELDAMIKELSQVYDPDMSVLCFGGWRPCRIFYWNP